MTICPFATWRPVQNHSGAMASHLGLVLHVQQGNGGLSGWFNNPASQASSTFWVSKAGALEQYVDADLRAWAQSAGNYTYNSVETEGWTTEPLTPQAEAMLARLYRWGHDVYGWPNALAEQPNQRGFGYHAMGGAAWGGHPCPGDLRKNRRQSILDTAFRTAPVPPIPKPPKEDDEVSLTIAVGKDGSDDGRWYVTDLYSYKTYIPSAEAAGEIIWCVTAGGGHIYHNNNGPVPVNTDLLRNIPDKSAR